ETPPGSGGPVPAQAPRSQNGNGSRHNRPGHAGSPPRSHFAEARAPSPHWFRGTWHQPHNREKARPARASARPAAALPANHSPLVTASEASSATGAEWEARTASNPPTQPSRAFPSFATTELVPVRP